MIIGRNGEQPFKITAEGVSAHHASLTFMDNGTWILEDLDSTNGTYVRNEDFVFERIVKKVIDKDTVIRLGDETVNGFTFIALQLVKTDQNDYTYEFGKLRSAWKKLIVEREKHEKFTTIIGFAPIALSIVCFGLTFLPMFDNADPVKTRAFMTLPSFASPIIGYWGKKRAKQFSLRMANTMVCPKCGRILNEQEVRKAQCLACKAHG